MKYNLTTLIISFFLTVLMITAGILVVRQTNNKPVSRPGTTPKEVKVTNITENGFTVSWITPTPSEGYVQWGENYDLKSTAFDDRDEFQEIKNSYTTHHVTIRNAQPETKAFFKLYADGIPHDYNGKPFEVTTAPALTTAAPNAQPIYGNIVESNGAPAQDAIVYLTINNSSPLSTITTETGSWAIAANSARSENLESYALNENTKKEYELFVQSASLETANAVTVEERVKPVPKITLGKTYDFRAQIQEEPPAPSFQDLVKESPDSPKMAKAEVAGAATSSAESSPSLPVAGNPTPAILTLIAGSIMIFSGLLWKLKAA